MVRSAQMPDRRTPCAWIAGLTCGVILMSWASVEAQRPRAPQAAASGPQLYQSRNFHVLTDLDAEQAEELLDRLETMLRLVSNYFGRPNTKPIEMYVVSELSRWPAEILGQMDENGLEMIRGGGGLTVIQVITNGQRFDSKAVVYAVARRGTPQHEAVHAYCGHAFGRTGPVWYSEGMAEVGNYWRENDKSVNAEPYVIEYLRTSETRPLADIVNNPLERTGDSWQNYAWRWALCHLLGFNENYTQRFKPLGLQPLQGNNVDFWQVYGDQAPEIEFEYRQFLKEITSGYRVDLCSWDWRTRFRGLRGTQSASCRIQANRGWQASRLSVSEGVSYQFTITGEWSTGDEQPLVSAAGDAAGRGRLVGVIQYQDDAGHYQLTAPIDLGAAGEFTASRDGNLFLRCQDDWGAIHDNRGQVSGEFTLSKP